MKFREPSPGHDMRMSPSHAMNMPSLNPPSLQSYSPQQQSDIGSPKAAAASLSLPLNNMVSSLSGTHQSTLNGSPRPSSTTPNVPSPLVASPRHAGTLSNAASSPIYMPSEHRPMLIQSNVMERSESA